MKIGSIHKFQFSRWTMLGNNEWYSVLVPIENDDKNSASKSDAPCLLKATSRQEAFAKKNVPIETPIFGKVVRTRPLRGRTAYELRQVEVFESSMKGMNHVPLLEPFDEIVAKMEEGAELEKKTSIVFPAGSPSCPDPERQLGMSIMRVIAGMMNSRGGWIYFGVHDKNGSIPGIDADLPHLRMTIRGTQRQYDGYDGWTRMVQDCVSDRLGAYAKGRIEPEMRMASNGAVVGCVRVMPCRDERGPVLFNGELLVRNGSETSVLRNGARDEFMSGWKAHLAGLPPPETDSGDGLYLSIWDNGDVTYRERKRANASLIRRVAAPRSCFRDADASGESNGLLFCVVRDDATLSSIPLPDIAKSIQYGMGIAKNAVSSPGSVIAAFAARPDSFLYVKTRWQKETDGFKLFEISSAVADGKTNEAGWTNLRFLDNANLEILETHPISRSTLARFVMARPVLIDSGSVFPRHQLASATCAV